MCAGLKAVGLERRGAEGDHVRLGADSRALPASMGSLEFSKKLLADAKIAVAPGIGFGHYGDGHVRFALIENEARTRQALRGIKDMFRGRTVVSESSQSKSARAINVGLLGIGTVGGGTFAVLARNQEEIARRAGCAITMKMVADKDLERARTPRRRTRDRHRRRASRS